MKKIVALLAGLTMMTSVFQLPVSAASDEAVSIPMQKSENPDYELYKRIESFIPSSPDNPRIDTYEDFYYNVTHTDGWIGGRYHKILGYYSWVFVTINASADIDALKEALGQTCVFDSINNPVQDNQIAFFYNDAIDYNSVYSIDGVEKVELVKRTYTGGFQVETGCIPTDDPAFIETYFNLDDYQQKSTSHLLGTIVYTEADDVQLTPEMFNDTGFDVIHVTKIPYVENAWIDTKNAWITYLDYSESGIEAFTDFIPAVECMDGIAKAQQTIILDEDASAGFAFEEVVKIGDNGTDEWLVGDLNLNNVIDLEEVVAFLECYAQTCAGLPTTMNGFDLNNDGRFDMFEVDYLMQCYAKSAAGLA